MAPGPSFSSFWTHFFPPKPTFTEKDVPDVHGKVYIVTGSSGGIGQEVARILYTKNATVYIAARSAQKAAQAIEDIKTSAPASTGALVFLPLDLSDLEQVKTAAQSFLAREHKLHVLFNNAGIMVSPAEPPAQTAQGYELALGVNCIGTFLFTKLLTPVLATTARLSASESASESESESGRVDPVRVVWLSSFGLELFASENVGISLDNLDYHVPKPATERYGVSKCGAWALGVEFAKRHHADGILSVPINPGNLRSELPRHQGAVLKMVARMLGYPVVNGAYTELFAAFSPLVTIKNSDWSKNWIVPFGRFYPLRPDLPKATMSPAEGGTAGTSEFWKWTEDQVKSYL